MINFLLGALTGFILFPVLMAFIMIVVYPILVRDIDDSPLDDPDYLDEINNK